MSQQARNNPDQYEYSSEDRAFSREQLMVIERMREVFCEYCGGEMATQLDKYGDEVELCVDCNQVTF